jgi:hypothetical protein
MEVGLGQAGYVAALLGSSGAFRAVRVGRDLAGHDRVVLGERVA